MSEKVCINEREREKKNEKMKKNQWPDTNIESINKIYDDILYAMMKRTKKNLVDVDRKKKK